LDTATILAELEAERDRLNRAIAALQEQSTRRLTLSGKLDRCKRSMSAAARRRIGEAMKEKLGGAQEESGVISWVTTESLQNSYLSILASTILAN
jgi:hypothetical protein